MLSRAGPGVDRRGESGFTLLEMVCVIAIFAMLAAIVVPALPRGTSRARAGILCDRDSCVTQSRP